MGASRLHLSLGHLFFPQGAHQMTNNEDDEKLADALRQRYNKLRELWDQAEQELAALRVAGTIEVSDELGSLLFTRINHVRRICYKYAGQDKICPIADTAIEIKMRAIPLFTALKNKCREYGISLLKPLDESIEDLKSMVD